VVEVSDYLGVDIYQLGDPKGPELDVTDPAPFFKVLRHWIENYAGDKDVIVCENGFTTVTEHFPDITWRTKGRYAGSEQQQLRYYGNMLSELGEANKPGGILRNKLRGYHIWSYRDNLVDEPGKGAYEKYFGLVRLDGTHKPAFDLVKDEIMRLGKDPVHRPVELIKSVDVTENFLLHAASTGIALEFLDGNDYEYLKIELPPRSARLHIITALPGCLLSHVNDQAWLSRTKEETLEFELDLDFVQDRPVNEPITVELYFTGSQFPFKQRVKSILVDGKKI
jgi:hypothetical protein